MFVVIMVCVCPQPIYHQAKMEIREYKTKRKIANKVDGFLLKKQTIKTKTWISIFERSAYLTRMRSSYFKTWMMK